MRNRGANVPDAIGVFIASGILSACGGIALYIQSLRRNGERMPFDPVACLGSVLMAGVVGISVALCLFWWLGNTPEGRLWIIGVNGLIGAGLIGVGKIMPKIFKVFGGDTDAASNGGRRSARPDSDVR